VGAPSIEPAMEEVTVETPLEVPTTGAAVAEVAEAGGRRPVAGAPSSGPQSVQGYEPEVVHGRHLLPSLVEVPLPRLLVKDQRVMEEAEAGFQREWEKLEVEHLRLSDWERQLGNCIQVVSSRTTEERAKLEQECKALHEKIRRTFDWEVTVASRERAVARKEKEVELKEQTARHTIDTVKAMAKTIDDEQATLNHREHNLSLREVAVKEEDHLSALRSDLEARARALEDQRLRQEEESRSLSQRLQVLEHREAEVEGLLAEQCTGVQRIAKWVGEESTTLEPLGLSLIQVAEAPSSIGSILPALDSTAEHLQCLESTLVVRLESEGWELARMVVDHVLTCFWSHDPTISLTPVLMGPVLEAEATAREGIQEAVEIVASRFECNVELDL
jgi:hypothetical protein